MQNLIRHCILQHLIWLYSICSGSTAPVLRLIMVIIDLYCLSELFINISVLKDYHYSSLLLLFGLVYISCGNKNYSVQSFLSFVSRSSIQAE